MHDDNDVNGTAGTAFPPPPPAPPPYPAAAPRRGLLGRRAATIAVAGGLMVGGITGGYMITQAATATPSATAPPDDHASHDGSRSPASYSQDLSQAASAIGISLSQLQTEMAAGKTIAASAAAHNVSSATVISTLVTAENAEIDASLKAGQITAAQATQQKSQVTARVTAAVNGTAPVGGRGGFGRFGGARGEDAQVVATAIGITTTQLQTELTAGKTIAAIAVEHRATAATVINALVASENTEIDQRVSGGEITAAEAATEKAETTQRVTAEVNGTAPAGGGFGRWGGPGFGAPSGDTGQTN